MAQENFESVEDAAISNIQTFFDDHGRCIPHGINSEVSKDIRRYFLLEQPEINYADIYARLKKHLKIVDTISELEFEQRAETILKDLQNDPQTSNIAKGIRVPFILPQAEYLDYGDALEKIYINAVNASYDERFPKYSFVNHHKNNLVDEFTIAAGSRHEKLIQAMSQSQVVGYYFPCLTEYSIPAAIEQVQNLPDKFMLAGGFDTSAALVATPELLLRTDGYPPLLWFGALLGKQENAGFHYEAYGYNLTFNRRMHFGKAAESWACGLVVLG